MQKRKQNMALSAQILGVAQTAGIHIKKVPRKTTLPKVPWLKLRILSADESKRARALIRDRRLDVFCEEIACPNLPECLGQTDTASRDTGKIPPRRCPLCTVNPSGPTLSDPATSENLADRIRTMGVKYVVITAAGREEEPDGGATHLRDCIAAIRKAQADVKVEILSPDFHGPADRALDVLAKSPPDVFNCNLRTVPRLYPEVRPGADYNGALDLLKRFARRFPKVKTTSGVMVGLGEELDEIRALMRDLRAHDCRLLTIRQYLTPYDGHLPVERHVRPEEFEGLRAYGKHIGFEQVVSGSLVRSSFRADIQAAGILSATEPPEILIIDDDGQGAVTAVGSLRRDLDIPSTRDCRDYNLTIGSRPMVSRLLSSPS